MSKKTAKKVHWCDNLEEIRYFEVIHGERGWYTIYFKALDFTN